MEKNSKQWRSSIPGRIDDFTLFIKASCTSGGFFYALPAPELQLSRNFVAQQKIMRSIKAIHKATYEPIGDLVTYRVLPTASVAMNQLDPFIFLNHHGWQHYPPGNFGLPFGPHPHRGFETVTFILEGELTHKDSSGAASSIRQGGVQWMTAGSGLVHAEISSEEFKQTGGPLEILQLWINLPARYKMTAPRYIGLQQNEIPTVSWSEGQLTARVICGEWEGVSGAVRPLVDIHLLTIHGQKGGQHTFGVPREHTVFFYVVKGEVKVNDAVAIGHDLVEFGNDGETLSIELRSDAVLLFGHALPFREPFVAYGPFVMNTREEIMQAYDDYHKGKFGSDDLL